MRSTQRDSKPRSGSPGAANEQENTSVLGRAFCLLDAFVPDGREMGLSELAQRTKLAKATVHRLANQLIELGVLERSGQRYRPGLHLFELGAMATRQRRLRDVALPFMEDLYEATHETVHLGVVDRTEVVYLEKIVGPRGSPVATHVGTRKPLYCTGIGKAILAFGDPLLLEAVCSQSMERRTPYTLATRSSLAEELEQIRKEGVAYDREEYNLGTACVAAPIADRDGQVIAAISLTGPTGRFIPSRYAPAVRTAALALSRALAAPLRSTGR
jgi:IclR family acetate operon transcriptional repressor